MSYRGRITQASRDERFKEMWGKIPRWEIAKKLGFVNVDNVSHTAKRLNLPPLLELCERVKPKKAPKYREGKRDISKAQAANRLRWRDKKAKSRAKAKAGINYKHANPEPECWRCSVCDGVSYEGPVHASHGEAA